VPCSRWFPLPFRLRSDSVSLLPFFIGWSPFCTSSACYYKTGSDYTLEEVDLFAGYVIPEDAWYLIPTAVLLRDGRKGAMLFPVVHPVKKNSFHYERYMDGWWLLTKTRRELAKCD
jgi:hypothetical protein